MAETFGEYNTDWTDRYHFTPPEGGGSIPGYHDYQNRKQQRRALREATAHKREWAKGPRWEEGLAYGTVNVTESESEFLGRMDRGTSAVRKGALEQKASGTWSNR